MKEVGRLVELYGDTFHACCPCPQNVFHIFSVSGPDTFIEPTKALVACLGHAKCEELGIDVNPSDSRRL